MWKRMSFKTLLQGFSKQICLKSNIDERVQKIGFLYDRNPNYVFFYQYLSSNTYLGRNLCVCVWNDILFHIMIQFQWNFAIMVNLELTTLKRGFKVFMSFSYWHGSYNTNVAVLVAYILKQGFNVLVTKSNFKMQPLIQCLLFTRQSRSLQFVYNCSEFLNISGSLLKNKEIQKEGNKQKRV